MAADLEDRPSGESLESFLSQPVEPPVLPDLDAAMRMLDKVGPELCHFMEVVHRAGCAIERFAEDFVDWCRDDYVKACFPYGASLDGFRRWCSERLVLWANGDLVWPGHTRPIV